MKRINSSNPKYECLLFDMDDTLYPLSTGINLACKKNIIHYMVHNLHIEESEVPKMCLDLYREHGTTMAGLKELGYRFDNDEFHAYVHGTLPYDKLKPDPILRSLLLSIPQRKIIFTNADKNHAAIVLNKLGLEDCFEGVICFETLNPPQLENVDLKNGFSTGEADSDESGGDARPSKSTILCKPSIKAMEAAIKIANLDAGKTIFFDDSARNIESGKAAGFHTVLVGRSTLVPGADAMLESLHNIKEALPEIWEDVDQVEPIISTNAVETVVLA